MFQHEARAQVGEFGQTEVPDQVGLLSVRCPFSVHHGAILFNRKAHHLVALCIFFVASFMFEDGILPLLELLVTALDGGKERLQVSIEPENVLCVELRRLLGHVKLCSDHGDIKASQRDTEKVPSIFKHLLSFVKLASSDDIV